MNEFNSKTRMVFEAYTFHSMNSIQQPKHKGSAKFVHTWVNVVIHSRSCQPLLSVT